MTELRRDEAGADPAMTLLGTGMPGLSDDERAALGHLRVVHRFVGRGRPLLRRGTPAGQVRILCKGWAIRSRRLDGARRQVLDVLLAGDLVGLDRDDGGTPLSDADALTACEVAEIDVKSLDRIASLNPGVAAGLTAFATRQLVRASYQVLRLGHMTAYERVSNFLLDIRARQNGAAQAAVDFPVTQTIMADMLGLSVVHVNRQVMQLRREGLVTLTRRQLVVHDEARLAAIAGFGDQRFAPPAPLHVAAE
jgi:CRP-like cAMP-binding protein